METNARHAPTMAGREKLGVLLPEPRAFDRASASIR